MTENERVREIRKAKSLTMEKFGEKIGLTRATISRVESGNIAVTDQTRRSICREFNISEEWLRTGAGEMDNAPDEFSLDALAREHDASDLERQLIKAFFELDKATRSKFMDKMSEVFAAKAQMETAKEIAPAKDWTNEQLHRMVDEHDAMEKATAMSQASTLTGSKLATGVG